MKKINKFSSGSSVNLDANSNFLNKIDLSSCKEVEENLTEELQILERCLQNSDFGVGQTTIGSELELPIFNNNNLAPAMCNISICDLIKSDHINVEMSKFCLEYNAQILLANQQPLNSMRNEFELAIANINRVSSKNLDASVVPIGIIPTINLDNLDSSNLTPFWRYKFIDKLLKAMRNNRDFVIDINGQDPLHLKWHTTVLEGVNSSFQVHLRVNPHEYNDMYNAAQLAAAFVLSVSGNSPLLFGHRLWEETRIAVFEQIVNNSIVHSGCWQEQQRVSFGRGWIKNGALGLFKELCELFYPLFPRIEKDNNIDAQYTGNNGPQLLHLIQHNSSVWPWNRSVYDPADGGHFRIEMRYLPSGPTISDMISNAGFMLGLTKALSKEINQIICCLPFKYVQYNFYQAAQYGLEAKCIWYDKNSKSLKELPVVQLLDHMLELSALGLSELGVSSLEVNSMRSCLDHRIRSKQTGANWQKVVYNKLINDHGLTSKIALEKMFRIYIDNQQSNKAVSMWETKI